jgi:Ni,Fe-hydrogenase III small subunit/ferredoxin
MIDVLRARIQQGHRTMRYPDGPAPELPERFVGLPLIDSGKCNGECREKCAAVCPVNAISVMPGANALTVDTGRCLFCRACEEACECHAVSFSRNYRLAAVKREALKISGAAAEASLVNKKIVGMFGRSLKLREVSAAGCNACEADTNVLNTLAWDLGRFGIQFVASPRHADGILVTGPVSRNMHEALLKTYDAVADPKIVIAVGACAIAGGPYIDHEEVCNGVTDILPVDLFIPGCPPHPLTILDGLLRFLGLAE